MATNLLRGHGFDLSVSVLGALLGAGILIVDHLGTTFPTFSPYDLGPSAVPDVVAILMIVLSGVLLLQAWRSSAAPVTAAEAEEPGETQGLATGAGEVRRLLLLALLFTAYIAGFWALGFIVPTIAFLLVFYRALGSKRWLKNIVVAVVFTVTIYVVFRHIFGVPIPARLLDTILVG